MLLTYKNPRIRALVEHLQQTDEDLTQEQEQNLAQWMAEEEGVLDHTRAILELELDAQRIEDVWVTPWQKRVEKLRSRAKAMRSMLADRLTKILEGAPRRSIRSPEFTVVLMSGRPSLDLGSDRLQNKTEARGYTESEMEESGIPLMYFEPVTVFVPRSEVIRAHLAEGVRIGTARMVDGNPFIQIRLPGKEQQS